MPSFASLSKPLVIGKGRDHKSYPPVSMKSPTLPETLHLDTSDLLVSVQSVPFHSDQDSDRDEERTEKPSRPSWHRNDVYIHSEPSFVGGHQYRLERQEERRRLRSLGLLTVSTPIPQSDHDNLQSVTAMSPPEKQEGRRRSSWQPAVKGKLQKRNKSRDPDKRKSMDQKPPQRPLDYQSIPQSPLPQYSFSRIQTYPASSVGDSCTTPTSQHLAHRSCSSFGTAAMHHQLSQPTAPSLGSLVEFYDPNSPGQAFTTSPSSPVVSYNSPLSSHNPSPIGFHRPRYMGPQIDSPAASTAPSPLPHIQQPLPLSTSALVTAVDIPVQQSPLMTPPDSRGNSSPVSVDSPISFKPQETKPASYQPYQPKYAAKSHVTSTTPLAKTASQEPAGVPFVHLDFAPPTKPFARTSGDSRRSSPEARLTTQEAKEYNAIAQATREALNTRILQSPSETSLSGSKANGRPQLTPSRLSYEMRPRNAPSPDSQTGRLQIPPKSILRKTVDLTEGIPELYEGPHGRRQRISPAARTPSEPASPMEPLIESDPQLERGRPTVKQGGSTGADSLVRRSSMSARRSIDVETPSAKNFDISKYTQEKAAKPAQAKPQRAYPPVSYKPYSNENSSSSGAESSGAIPPVPPVPPMLDTLLSVRGLSTPPPIVSETAIEEDDLEAPERPLTATEAQGSRNTDAGGTDVIEGAPARRRAPSMSEILKDLYKSDASGDTPPETNEHSDWLSQLFRGKKMPENGSNKTSRPQSRSRTSTPLTASPQPDKVAKEPKRSPRLDLSADGQRVHERAERQRLEVERKLMEAQSDPPLTPRSPRFHRSSTSVTASPDLRVPGTDGSSLRSASTTSVDRLDPVVGGGLNIVRADELPVLPLSFALELDEKKPDRSTRPSSAEVRQKLGEMTPPHEREDWSLTRDSQIQAPAMYPPQLEVPAPPSPQMPTDMRAPSPPPAEVATPPLQFVPGRLPIGGVSYPPPPAPAAAQRQKESHEPCLDHKSSNGSLPSLDVTKTLTRILVICCGCNRLHDPPSDIYRKMAQGDTSFRCPYCVHPINVVECCSAYTSICNLVERLNRK
ncbi:hypothetical protein DRE_01889 [Drechslerella stenobrocha 248]|uniref:Uncharacterized protein n=1 Tax=Drechslerella stenobrocha 248 TaxID=1043628 RepID=W7I9A8_9PEZI|nr:hypothetical protein DRE_01889 [Drechslerella stenobrocha 248]